LAHLLAIGGAQYAQSVARAARLLIAYEHDGLSYDYPDIPPKEQPGTPEVEAYYADHADELQHAAREIAMPCYTTAFFRPGVICFFYVLFNRQNESLAKLFLYQLARGLQSPATSDGLASTHPVFTLREKLNKDRAKLKKPTMSHIIGMTLKTWIAVRDGKAIGRLHVQRNDHFPDIDHNLPPETKAAASSQSK
jgi:hypothetical protein